MIKDACVALGREKNELRNEHALLDDMDRRSAWRKGCAQPSCPAQAAAADADVAGVEVSWNQSIEPLAGSRSIIKINAA